MRLNRLDRKSTDHRSWNMSWIRGTNTQPELSVRSILHRVGYRLRLHPKDLIGRRDIVLPGQWTATFVHGCCWLRHPGCRFAYEPKSRQMFWQKEFEENVARDSRNPEALFSLGWRAVLVWECELRDRPRLQDRQVICDKDVNGGVRG